MKGVLLLALSVSPVIPTLMGCSLGGPLLSSNVGNSQLED
jgi:hypothetical protein